MKSIVALLLLSQAGAIKLPPASGSHALAQTQTTSNPEVSDIMEYADDKEYMESQRGILAEQDMKDTTKYTMSAKEYNSLMQKE